MIFPFENAVRLTLAGTMQSKLQRPEATRVENIDARSLGLKKYPAIAGMKRPHTLTCTEADQESPPIIPLSTQTCLQVCN
jgi:hypothetical protein